MRKRGTIACLLAALCLAGKAQIPVSEQFYLEVAELRSYLADAPLLNDSADGLEILIPTPRGIEITYQVWADPVLSDALQAEYPEYRTYALQNEAENYSGRLLLSPSGLDAVLVGHDQVMFVESVESASDLHRIHYWKLGPDYLSFNIPGDQQAVLAEQVMKLAILADESYVDFHQEDLTKAVLASVNGLNAILDAELGIRFQLHYFDEVDRMEILECRTAGFRGRAGESLKLFGDRIAAGQLGMEDFDLAHLFSGRGFGTNALAAVAGSDSYVDWNEDQTYDGPAKAGGGTGAVRPVGDAWWGNLCRGILRQLMSSDLALNLQRSAQPFPEPTPELTGATGIQASYLSPTRQVYAGLRTLGIMDFPSLSFLPDNKAHVFSYNLSSLSLLVKDTLPDFRNSMAGGAMRPFFLHRTDLSLIPEWLYYWRFR